MNVDDSKRVPDMAHSSVTHTSEVISHAMDTTHKISKSDSHSSRNEDTVDEAEKSAPPNVSDSLSKETRDAGLNESKKSETMPKASRKKKKPVIGPSLPPHMLKTDTASSTDSKVNCE